jgi:hypothetical protein
VIPAVGVVTPEGLETSGADPRGVYQIGSPALDELPVGDVTLGALVTHTSGLPRLLPGMWRKAFGAGARNPYADIDEPALHAAVGALKPRPRARPVYSNLGFGPRHRARGPPAHVVRRGGAGPDRDPAGDERHPVTP